MSPGTRLRTTLAAFALALLPSCAQITARGMTVTQADLPSAMNPDLSRMIAVTEATAAPSWQSQVDDGKFGEALIASLRLAGLLAEGATAPLTLSVRLLRSESAPNVFDSTIKTVAQYTLLDSKSGTKVIDERITASHTATFSDAAIGVTRRALAEEVSARKNIAAAIGRINSIRRVGPPAPTK